MLKLSNISKTYNKGKVNEFKALKNIDLEIKDGDFVAIMGESGAGKTTMLNIMNMTDSDYDGEYDFDGTDAKNLSHAQRCEFLNKKIATVFQNFLLIDEAKVLDNIVLPLYIHRLKKKEMLLKCKEVLDKVGILDKYNDYVDTLSGGEKQRVAIARSLIINPKVLFADEPTGALDSKTAIEIMEIFKKLNEEGCTIIMITHNHEMATYAKKIITMSDGVIIS
ncbi:MAG: ABC transporter ATP-binding protein [Clostridia bacterium]